MPAIDRLSSMDAVMLYLENDTFSFDVAALFRVDGPIPFEEYVTDFTHRLEYLPRFKQRLSWVPFNLGHPTWEDDPAFDLRDHIRRVDLSSPGSEEQLNASCVEAMRERLELRRKPPWMIYVVNGLEDGGAALIAKVHHCMTDGMGGQKIYAAIVDFVEQSIRTEPALTNGKASRMSPKTTRMAQAIEDGIRVWGGRLISKPRRRREARLNGPRPAEMDRRKALLKSFTESKAIRYSFNGVAKGPTEFVWTEFALSELRAIRAAHGGTVNDVVLALVGDVMSRVARDEGHDPAGHHFRIHLAANMRANHEYGEWGNRVSLLPIPIALGEDDPVARLRQVTEFTRAAKDCNLVEEMEKWINRTLKNIPAPIMRWSSRLMFSKTFNRFVLMMNRPPAINMYLTNIRWPEVPAYIAQQRVLNMRPLVPAMPGVGLTCAAITYHDRLQIVFAGEQTETLPLERLIAYLEDAFRRLQATANAGEMGQLAVKRMADASRA